MNVCEIVTIDNEQAFEAPYMRFGAVWSGFKPCITTIILSLFTCSEVSVAIRNVRRGTLDPRPMKAEF